MNLLDKLCAIWLSFSLQNSLSAARREETLISTSITETRLLPAERQKRIRDLVNAQGTLRIADLAETFGVSEMTIRRDFEALATAGHLERTFGGAVAAEQTAFESSHKVRLYAYMAEKEAIARYAATLVQDGDTIALDASTSCLALARELARRQLTVVTNGLDSAQELRAGGAKVIVTGGYLRQVAGSFAGPLALRALQDLRVDHAFISAKGVLPGGLMDSDIDEVEVKRAMLNGAAHTTALVDSSKFGQRALARVASLDAFDLLVTDSGLADTYRAELAAGKTAFHIVEVGA